MVALPASSCKRQVSPPTTIVIGKAAREAGAVQPDIPCHKRGSSSGQQR